MKRLVVALALTAAASVTAPTALADTVVTVAGSAPTPPPAPDLATLYGGIFAGDTLAYVAYPASLWPLTPTEATLGTSVGIGVGLLDTAVHSAAGPTVVLGWSQGAVVIDDEQQALIGQPTVPGLSFIVAGDPTRPGGILSYLPAGTYVPILNYTTKPVPASQYDTTVLTITYDGIADFPDRPWNAVADVNALMGAAYYHPEEGQYLPTSGGVTTVNANGGSTTTYLEAAPYLPLTHPLTQLGVPKPIVDALDKVLTPVVDAGYSRNDDPSAPVTAPHLVPGGGITPLKIKAPAVSKSKAPASVTKTPERAHVAKPKIAKTIARALNHLLHPHISKGRPSA